MTNCSRRKRVTRERRTNIQQQPTQTIASLCHHLPSQYNTHSPSLYYICLSPPFPNSSDTFPSSSTLQNSFNHWPTILHTSSNSTSRSHSNSKQPTKKWATYSPTPLSHITPLIINHSTSLILQQLSWTNPQHEQQPQTWPCTDLTSLHSCIIFCQPTPF